MAVPYTVLARRYRSANFDQLVGQDHVAITLKKAITSGRVAHAFLFCGTRGAGKTSTARILAKCLNCLAFDAPTPDPCGKCSSCLGIARGDDVDVTEIDAASNTQVDKMRDLIDNSAYRPNRARFKIYIIDEAHMLSKSSFNALLKTLEEPPEHVKFILATTEPEKILPTIHSRCQRFDFRNVPVRDIVKHLAAICKSEGVAAEEPALLMVAQAAAGSIRDGLSILDRLLSVGEKTLTLEAIRGLLGAPAAQTVFDLADAIGSGDVAAVLQQTDAIIATGMALDTLAGSLCDHLRNLLILRTCGPAAGLVEVPGIPTERLVAQAAKIDPAALAQDILILEDLRRNLRNTSAPRPLTEATLVRLALAEQFVGTGPGSSAAASPAEKKSMTPP